MAATGLLVQFFRDRGTTYAPRRPSRFLTRYDTKIAARAQFMDGSGAAIALAGVTVHYTLKDLVTSTLIISRGVATVEDQALNPGEAFYAFVAGQLAHELTCLEEWHLTYTDTTTETFPVGRVRQVVSIVADLDAI